MNPDGSEQHRCPWDPVDLANPDLFAPTPWEAYTYDANDNAGRTHAHAADRHTATLEHAGQRRSRRPRPRRQRRRPQRSRPRPGRVHEPVPTTSRATWSPSSTRSAARPSATATTSPGGVGGSTIDAGRRDTVLDALGTALESRDSKGALTLAASTCCAGQSGAGPVTTPPARSPCASAWSTATAAPPTSPPPNASWRARTICSGHGRPLRRGRARHGHRRRLQGQPLEASGGCIADAPVLAVYDDAASNGWHVAPFQVDWQPGPGQTSPSGPPSCWRPTGYTTTTSYDALGRPIRQLLPVDVEGRRRELRPEYNRAGGLERVRRRRRFSSSASPATPRAGASSSPTATA